MRYTIGYDLITPGNDYDSLYKELRRLGCQKLMLSEWVGRFTNNNATQIRDHFRGYIDANDRLMVTCLDGADWAGWNLMTNPNNV